MKAIYFTNLQYGDTADLVRCNWCGCEQDMYMLIPCGYDVCPLCGEIGYLDWAEDETGSNIDEVNLEKFLSDPDNEVSRMEAKFKEVYDEEEGEYIAVSITNA